MTAVILGKKLGMTSLFSEAGIHIPCTVIEAGPCPVIQVKNGETDGYSAIQIGFGEKKKKNSTKPEIGHFKKSKTKPSVVLKEFRISDSDFKVGSKLTVEQFKKGDKVRVSGTGKGKGFQGVVRRHHFAGVGMTTHGQSDRMRAPGSIGSSSYPSRVFKGIKMGGRMGGKRISVRNLEVVEVISDQNILLIKGSVPGSINSFLEIVK